MKTSVDSEMAAPNNKALHGRQIHHLYIDSMKESKHNFEAFFTDFLNLGTRVGVSLGWLCSIARSNDRMINYMKHHETPCSIGEAILQRPLPITKWFGYTQETSNHTSMFSEVHGLYCCFTGISTPSGFVAGFACNHFLFVWLQELLGEREGHRKDSIKEQQKHGIFYEDDYDYLQHIKPPTTSVLELVMSDPAERKEQDTEGGVSWSCCVLLVRRLQLNVLLYSS